MTALGEQETIYVVDDDQAIRQSLTALLQSVGYQVQAFDSGQAFLATAFTKSSKPACVVLDVRMPGTSGLETQRLLNEKPGFFYPIIFVTAHADVPIAIQAMKQGAFDFIEKPYSEQLLLDKITDALAYAQKLAQQHDQQ